MVAIAKRKKHVPQMKVIMSVIVLAGMFALFMLITRGRLETDGMRSPENMGAIASDNEYGDGKTEGRKAARLRADRAFWDPTTEKGLFRNGVDRTMKMGPKRLSKDRLKVSSSTRAKHTETHWCVISNSSMWPDVNKYYWGWQKSMAHSAEAVLPCWSWFVEMNATNQCGFIFLDNMLGRRTIGWTEHMISKMNCTSKGYPPISEDAEQKLLAELPIHKHFPFQEEFWINSTKAAQQLTNLVLPRPQDRAMLHEDKLNVGVVLRRHTRQFADLPSLLSALEASLGKNGSEAVYDAVSPDELSPFSQARWFATKHIVIAAHGAALTNAVFVRPGTTVIQLYPKGYYFRGYFDSLIGKAGGVAMDWYDGDKSSAKDVHKQMSRHARERAKSAKYMHVDVYAVSSLARLAAERYYARGLPRPNIKP